MSIKVVIPTAGLGSRLEKLTQFINKSLVSVSNKPIISWQIDKFNEDTEFIIPIGYKGKLVEDYLNLVYPNKKITFVVIEKFEGPNSGLGHTLLKCENYLQQKFIFMACDSFVEENIPDNDLNWIGYSSCRTNSNSYRMASIKGNKLNKIHEKGFSQINNLFPYIGICQIKDFEVFWESMRNNLNESTLEGEAFGINSILLNKNEFSSFPFTWFDTGNKFGLEELRKKYKKKSDLNILEKENEHIWFVDNKVIKFSDDKEFIKNRVKRVNFLKGYVPEIVGSKSNMYLYHMFKGDVFSKIKDPNKFRELLRFCKNFWKKNHLDSKKNDEFKNVCKSFYKEKTNLRVNKFYKDFKKSDSLDFINDKPVRRVENLLNSIDWENISNGYPVRFHGDFHFENILFNENSFIFIDWRQEFGGNLEYGDLYYDLSKLLHGLIVNHGVIVKNDYRVEWNENKFSYSINRPEILLNCQKIFEEWLSIEKYDSKKVKIITGLIFLNICALHHYPYSLLLYGIGVEILEENV